MDTEAVLLTGGASARMGEDKANLLIEGVPLVRRIAQCLDCAGFRVTVLGRESVKGFGFQADETAFQGPLVALARFEPKAKFVFVAACDMPRFDARIVSFLRERIGNAYAAVPVLEARRQPLCALYSSLALGTLADYRASGGMSMMGWLERMDTREVDEAELMAADLDAKCFRGVNTPEELKNSLTLGGSA